MDARWRPLRRLPAGSEEAKKDSTAFNSADGGADVIGLVNTRCSRCGCLVTAHDVDDEERRGCQECECSQFEAPPDPVLGGEPGTPEWWRSPGYIIHGPADTILRLLEQEEISRRKALELLAYLHCGAPQDLRHALPPAPWDRLNWCDDTPAGAGLTVREACRRRVPLDGADSQALEHALTITERERDDALIGVEAGKRAAQSARELVNTLREIEVLCGEEDDSPRSAVERVISERHSLRDWKAGATGAATISYPPRGHEGGHNHRGCDCNEPDQPPCDRCGERKPVETISGSGTTFYVCADCKRTA